MGRIFATLAAAAVVALACDGSPDEPQVAPVGSLQPGIRDSAGVVIAQNAEPAQDSRLDWTVGSEPAVSIGTQEGDSDWSLYRVANAIRLSDGRIVVANGSSNQLLVFDEAGQYLDAWGRTGEGPGEFTGLDRVAAWSGDSIMASDEDQFRISVFDADGAHGRTSALPGKMGGLLQRVMGALRGQAAHTLLAPVADSFLLTWNPPAGMSGFQRQGHVFEIKSADGRPVASLGEHPGPQTYTATVDRENVMVFLPLRHPFGQTTEWTVWGDLVALGRTETYEIQAYRTDGSLARIVRREHRPGVPTRRQLDAGLEEAILGFREQWHEPLREVVPDVPMVESFPAFGPLRGDALGYLWVAEFRAPGDDPSRTVWTIFDQEGVVQGLVETPGDLTVYEIGADYVLGRVRDELGSEYVQVWRLDRG